MDQGVWCARALADSPDLVHEVHRRYLDAGAHVITVNSYSATREAMCRGGHGSPQFQRREPGIDLPERVLLPLIRGALREHVGPVDGADFQ